MSSPVVTPGEIVIVIGSPTLSASAKYNELGYNSVINFLVPLLYT